jgi:16S rRNA (cytosine967-C5)-methyltransferase
MKPQARIQAAIDVLESILDRHQPAGLALADWGKSHRFAGSGDRAAIGNVVYDALRHRALSAYHMRGETPRALVLGALHAARGLDVAAIEALCDGAQHAPAVLTGDERTRLTNGIHPGAADWQRANIPQWLEPHLGQVFGDRLVGEGHAMTARAPVDLRVNTLKADRAQVLEALAQFGATETPHSPLGIRIAAPTGDGRTPNVEAEAAHGKGWFEVQDEGSQIAAALTGVKAGQNVLDLCAGAGGKTLALAAAMGNSGKIHAYDSDKSRLRPIFERITRAGITNVEVMTAGDTDALDKLGGRFDVVLVDAPCSGAGTWRRKPDAKWRLKPDVLAARIKDQAAVLARAARHVKPGGRLVYVTCSLLADENVDQISAFRDKNRHFTIRPWRQVWAQQLASPPPARSADGRDDTLLLSPATHGTDGFFVAVLERTS